MKTAAIFSAVILVVGLTAGLTTRAADNEQSLPAPITSGTEQSAAVAEPVIIDHVVYLAKLPTPDELLKAAERKATPIVRMDQTADRIVVVYQYAGGQTVTYAYALLSSAGTARVSALQPASTANYEVVTPTPAPAVRPTVVYVESSPRYYPSRVRYYDPAWDFWAPFAVGVGIGWFGGHGSSGHGYSHGSHGSYGHGRH